MKRLGYYLHYPGAVKRVTMLLAATVIFVSLQGCQEEIIKPADDHRESPKHPPTPPPPEEDP